MTYTTAYTTVDAVKRVMPGGTELSEVSDPSLADAAIFITGASAEIDIALGTGGLSVPVLDETFRAYLDIKSAREVAWQIMAARNVLIASDKDAPEWTKWHDEFKAMLGAFEKGSIPGDLTSEESPDSYTRDADETDPTDDRNPVVTKSYVP